MTLFWLNVYRGAKSLRNGMATLGKGMEQGLVGAWLVVFVCVSQSVSLPSTGQSKTDGGRGKGLGGDGM